MLNVVISQVVSQALLRVDLNPESSLVLLTLFVFALEVEKVSGRLYPETVLRVDFEGDGDVVF